MSDRRFARQALRAMYSPTEALSRRLALHVARYERTEFNEYENRDKFVFLHIPKTGSTSFYSFLSSFFLAEEMLPAELQFTPIENWPADTLQKYRFFRGVNSYVRFTQDFTNVHTATMLRDPVQHLHSVYWHRRRDRVFGDRFPHLQNPLVVAERHLAKQMSFHNWVRAQENGRDRYPRNSHVAKLATDGKSTLCSTHLERAKEILRHELAFFGILERYADSKRLFFEIFGLPGHHAQGMEQFNGKQQSTATADIPDDIEMLLRRQNPLDVSLYQYARELFEQRWEQLAMTSGQVASGVSPLVAQPYRCSISTPYQMRSN